MRASASLDRTACLRVGIGVIPALIAIVVMGLGNIAGVPVARAATSLDSTATLTWSAPGDDGASGRAAHYEMRYRNAGVAGTDTLSWWNVAAVVPAMPAPGATGAVDSVTVRGLDPARTWYFILRTADEAPNWSNFSNIAMRAPYHDAIAPAAIVDLGLVVTSSIRGITPATVSPQR